MNLMPTAAMCVQEKVRASTSGRETYDVTKNVAKVLIRFGVRIGLCHIFVQHTSA